MLIKQYLEKHISRLSYPESDYSWQTKATREVLKIFQDINIDIKSGKERFLRANLHDSTTVVVKAGIDGEIDMDNINFSSDTYNAKRGKTEKVEYWIIKTKTKPIYTIVIREFFLKEKK